MDNNALVQLIVDALDDVKGQDIRVYDTTDKTSAFERVIVVSGTSNRQTRALAISAARAVKTAGLPVHGIEGLETAACGPGLLQPCGTLGPHSHEASR